MTLSELNALPDAAAYRELLACCGSPSWARRLASARPFSTADDLYKEADRALADLTDADLKDALDGHPRIGERRAGDATSAREQSAVSSAEADLLRAFGLHVERGLRLFLAALAQHEPPADAADRDRQRRPILRHVRGPRHNHLP